MNTRSCSEVCLIGKATPTIQGAGLPTVGAALRFLAYWHLECHKTLGESSKLTIQAVLPFWDKARIPTRRSDKCAEMLQKLWAKFRTLKKSRHRPGSSSEANEALFKADLQDLFDIAHQDALSLMTNEEDKAFLIMQREDTRSCSMGSKDKILEGREARKHKR